LLFFRTLIFFLCALGLLAQDTPQEDAAQAATSSEDYNGPAILSRGEVPSVQTVAPVAFRPYIGVSAIYDTGLIPVGVNSAGTIPTTALYGVELSLGAYTYHVWKHTTLALDYKGDFRDYSTSYWDSTDQFLSLILKHEPTKRVTITLRDQAGVYSNNYFLSSALGDTNTSYLPLPQYDIFDNRVAFEGASADLTYKVTRRLSLNVGGEGDIVRRQDSALFGVTSGVARADLQYRISRHTTVGADFRYTYFDYTQAFGNSVVESVGADYSTQFTPHVQLSARIGGARVTSQSLTSVTLSPALAALLGETTSVQAAYQQSYVPDIEVRLSNTIPRAVFSVSYVDQVIPGNGIYLTSRNNSVGGNFSYTGVRHWNFGVDATYGRMTTLVQTIGAYTGYGAGVGVTRDLGKGLHFVVRADGRHYDLASGALFASNEYRTSAGIVFSPGDLPLVLW
jgi:hypothetical protein